LGQSKERVFAMDLESWMQNQKIGRPDLRSPGPQTQNCSLDLYWSFIC